MMPCQEDIDEHIDKTFPSSSNYHQPLSCTSAAADQMDPFKTSPVTDRLPSSNSYELLLSSTAVDQADETATATNCPPAVDQEESDNPGVFLDYLSEMDYESLTAEHTPVAGPSQVTSDAPSMKCRRFGAVPSSDELALLSQIEVPRNTKRSTQWAVKVFNSWVEESNVEKELQYPIHLLEMVTDPGRLGRWLSQFQVSARNHQGNNYTPQSIHCILSDLLRYIRARNQ